MTYTCKYSWAITRKGDLFRAECPDLNKRIVHIDVNGLFSAIREAENGS